MSQDVLNFTSVRLDDEKSELILLDQTLLPNETEYIHLKTKEQIWEAIYKLQVRGAPAIGIAGAYGVYLGEIVFPILIIIGLYTRVSSFFFALTMVFAIFLAHGNDLFTLGKTGGPVIELALIYLLTSISLMFIGAGRFSFDGRNRRK